MQVHKQRGEKQMPLRYIPAVIIFLAVSAATIYFYQQESTYINGMNIARGVVIGHGNKSTFTTTTNVGPSQGNSNQKQKTVNTQAIVDFQVNGSKYRVAGRAMGYPGWKIGQSVDVYYSADNPRHSRIKRWDEVYFHTLLSGFFLIAMVIFAMINFIVFKIRGRPLS